MGENRPMFSSVGVSLDQVPGRAFHSRRLGVSTDKLRDRPITTRRCLASSTRGPLSWAWELRRAGAVARLVGLGTGTHTRRGSCHRGRAPPAEAASQCNAR
eukprot:scaffold141310_cov21-Tisochrysis_lutea.AAC.1